MIARIEIERVQNGYVVAVSTSEKNEFGCFMSRHVFERGKDLAEFITALVTAEGCA